MSNPKISVIVPVYNAEATLRRCVDSVLSQTFTDFECLLINDGSKDRSGEICDAYATTDGRVRIFHKENGGLSSARNVGLENANGEWVNFCDADDILPKDAFEKLYNGISDGVDLVIGGVQYIYSGYEYIPLNELFIGPNLILLQDNVVNSYFVTAWCKLYLRTYACKLRFDDKFVGAEDLNFNLQYLLLLSGVKFVDSIVYLYSDNSCASKYCIDSSRYTYQVDTLMHVIEQCCFKYQCAFVDIKQYILFYHGGLFLNNLLHTKAYPIFKKEVEIARRIKFQFDSRKKRIFWEICYQMPLIAFCGVKFITKLFKV